MHIHDMLQVKKEFYF